MNIIHADIVKYIASYIPVLFFIMLPIMIVFLFQKQFQTYYQQIFKTLSILLVALELFRSLYLFFTGTFDITTSLPVQLCFIYAFLCVLAWFSKKRYLYDYICLSSFPFGIGAILLFSYEGSFFQFEVLQSYMYHSIMILMGCLFYVSNYKPRWCYFNHVLFLFFCQLIFAHQLNGWLGGSSNYMFLSSIFEPQKLIYQTVTTDIFYRPILFGNSINQYLVLFKTGIGTFFYTSFFLTLMVVHYLTFFVILSHHGKIKESSNH